MKLKQRQRSYDVLDWSESEVETAEILAVLYHRFSLMSSVTYSWGCKKQRSAIQNNPSSYGGAAVVPPSSDAGKAQASSPATPLSFPATESDDKTKPLKNKVSLKRVIFLLCFEFCFLLSYCSMLIMSFWVFFIFLFFFV